MTDDTKALIAEARAWTVDWDGSQMRDGEPPRDGVTCALLRRLADALERATGEGANVKIYNPYGRLIAELAPGEEYHESMDYK